MASVKKRPDGRWRARYRDPAGKEHARHFDTRRDAERWLTTVEHSKLTGAYIDPVAGKVTFRTYAENWRTMQPHRASTAISVEQDLRLHIYPAIGDRPVAAVRSSEIQALVTGLSSKLAPATLERVYGRISAVFGAAARDRVIAVSPCAHVRLPRRGQAPIEEVLTPAQVHALAAAMPPRYRALVVAGAGLGLRPGELFGLATARIDFLRRTVRVDQQLVRVRGRGVELGSTKTPASNRTVPLPNVVGEALAGHLAAWPEHPELGLIFTNERGGPIQQHPFAMVWATARARAGLPTWATPHDLRHHYASVLIAAGASVKVVQRRLGHSSAVTTLDTYSHLFPDEEDRTRQAIDAALGAPADSARTEVAG